MYFRTISLILLFIVNISFKISSIYADSISIQKYRMQIDELIFKNKEYPQNRFLDQAFTQLELMKNLTIQESLFNYLLADSSKQKNKILQRYNYLCSKLAKSEKKTHINKYFAEIDSLKQEILENYPEYAFFILGQMPITVKKIQRKYLNEKEALLDFLVANDHIHVFIIKKDTFNVVTYKIEKESLSHKLITLTTPMYRAKNPLHLPFDLKLAHQLYNQIFAPLETFLLNIHSLIIIPDDILFGFPFECLVTNLDTNNKNKKNILYEEYTDVNFLIHKFAITYNFSTVALNPKYHPHRAEKKLGRELLTMSELTGLSNLKDTTNIGWNLQPPIFGNEEVNRVSRWLWRHTNLTGGEATVDFLKNNSFNFRWIYLAIPGMLNNKTPEASALLLSGSSDSLQKNILDISEIIDCKLRADLMTLSGCELRPVEIKRKIGVIGIPQSFLISGVQSVMFTLWRIHDNSICRFMSKFYWELKYKRRTNSFALQQAKLSSIKDTFKYKGREISRAHPYFWASYVLAGNANVRPPTFSTIPPRMVILLMYVLVFTVSIIIVRKTAYKNNKNKS